MSLIDRRHVVISSRPRMPKPDASPRSESSVSREKLPRPGSWSIPGIGVLRTLISDWIGCGVLLNLVDDRPDEIAEELPQIQAPGCRRRT